MTSEIIAEIGINWNGNMKLLREMIFCAKDFGCNTIKTQLYDSAKLFPTGELWIRGKDWWGEVRQTNLTKEQFFQFVEWCREVAAEPIASAFDLERLSWLEEAGVKRHKVATRMNQNKEYLEEVVDICRQKSKELIVSCLSQYYSPIVLPLQTKFLYCIPEYPTPLEHLHFDSIDLSGRVFPSFDGVSLHVPDITPAQVALSRGAKIVEVHFTLDRNMSGPDQCCSIEPIELRQLVQFASKVEQIL